MGQIIDPCGVPTRLWEYVLNSKKPVFRECRIKSINFVSLILSLNISIRISWSMLGKQLVMSPSMNQGVTLNFWFKNCNAE